MTHTNDLKMRVQIYGPVSQSAKNVYTWITIYEFVPDSLDIDYLKKKAMDIINKNDVKPQINAARLELIRNGKRDMKITLMDLW